MSLTNDIFASSQFNESIYTFSSKQQSTIREAIGYLETQLKSNDAFTNPRTVKNYCQLHIGSSRDEFFSCLFLDTQHRLIAFERLFRGTVDSANVYPRIVLRRTLELNAAAIIFAHNHPSGITTPSTADIAITHRLTKALELIDVRVLDHIIAGVDGCTSMAERSLL